MDKRFFLKSSLATTVALGTGMSFAADNSSSAPIKIVVPFSPGGSNDVFARALAQRLSEKIKRTVIVENKPGAGGAIGASFVSKSAADGTTLLLTSVSFLTNSAIQSKPAYDPVKSFTPVAMLNRGPMLVIVKGDSRYDTIAKLIDGIQKKEINTYASAGLGTVAQMATEMINKNLNANIVHVPYKGVSNAATDIIGGNVDMMITTAASVAGQIKSNHIRALAVTSAEASSFFPGVVPLAKHIPGIDVESWWGVFAAPNTPAEIINSLNKEIREVSKTKQMADIFDRESTVAGDMSPEEFRKFIEFEKKRWMDLAKERGIVA